MLVLGLSAVGAPARAGGIPVGRFEFYPSVYLEVARDNNIFNRSPEIQGFQGDPVVSDLYTTLRAPLHWRLPFLQSSWDLVYTPGLNLYRDNPLDGTTHELGTDLRLNFSTGARFELEASLLRDYLNTQAFDPGGEVAFGDSDYELSTFAVEYEQPLSSRHGFQLSGSFEALDFDGEEGSSFIDFNRLDLELAYLNYVSEVSTLFVNVFDTRSNQDRVRFEIDEDVWERYGVELGLQRVFDDRNRARFFLGYASLEFSNTDDSNYSGPVARVVFNRTLTRTLRLQIDALRRPNQSVFNVNNYYLTDRASLSFSIRPGGKVFYESSLSYQRNDYPDDTRQFCGGDGFIDSEPRPPGVATCPAGQRPVTSLDAGEIGVKRDDRYVRARAGLGVQLSRTAALELKYSYQKRNSNLNDFDFDAGVLLLQFRFGWIPDREFI